MNGAPRDPGESFEDWVRRLAPPPPSPRAIRKARDELWGQLHLEHLRRRRRSRGVLPLGFAALLVLTLLIPVITGTSSNKPVREGVADDIEYMATQFNEERISGLGDIPDSSRDRTFEAMVETEQTRHGQIKLVTGYSVRGSTIYTVLYQVEVDGRADRIGMAPVFPAPGSMDGMADFIRGHAAELIGMVDDGLAHDAGVATVFIDGHPVAMHRWTAVLPDYGMVAYLEGRPLD